MPARIMTQFTTSEYFNRLRKYSTIGWTSIQKYLASKNTQEAFKNGSGVYPKRSNRPSLRLFLSRVCYLLSNRSVSAKHELLLSVPEIFNIGTYEANVAIDDKFIGQNHDSSSANIIRSHLWHSLVFDIVCNSRVLSESKIARIAAYYGQCYEEVYLGQDLDTGELLFSHEDLSEAEFVRLYLRRCELIGASTIKTCAISAMLRDPEEQFPVELEALLTQIGVAGQMINDLSDCLPRNPVVKHKSNFADLRNRRLTLPYFLLLRRGYDPEYLTSRISSPTEAHDFLSRAFATENIHHMVIEMIKSKVHQGMAENFERLSMSCHPEAIRLLKGVADMPYNSKILKILDSLRL